MPRAQWWAAALALATVAAGGGLAGSVPAWADHGGGPSAQQVAAGQAEVALREAQVRRAAAAVARTQAALDRLNATAEIAVEAYDAARVKQAAAQQEVQAAQVVLDVAGQRVDTARQVVNQFATAAYESGGMSAMGALLASGDPGSLLDRIGTLQVISRSQRDAVSQLDAARVYQLMVRQRAAAALDRASAAARAADAARAKAQTEVAHQTALLSGLRTQQQRLADLLTQARAHASALERARLEALARARAEAAARAAAARAAAARQAAQQAASSGTTTTSYAGTVSAETEQRAVQAAESQIGKPYQWGAAGPDSYDCSGLTMWAYAQVGVTLDHWTGFQWNEGVHIPLSSLRPGDLVFFATDTNDPNTIHHVGMYIGNGEMVEAPYTGADVRISSAFRPDLIGAVRPYAG